MGAGWIERLRRGLRAVRPGEDLAAGWRVLRRLVGGGSPARPPRRPPALDAIRAVDEGRIEFGRAAIRIACAEDPSLDAEEAWDEVCILGIRLRRRLAGRREPADRVAALHELVFEEEGFGVDVGERERAAEGLLLPRVLARRSGHCVGLTSLYVALGERADLPLHPVRLPRHVFCRYDDGTTRINIEPTRRGARYPDRWYVRRYDLSTQRVRRGLYLRNLTRKEFLVEILNNVGNYRWAIGEADAAWDRIHRATEAGDSFAAGHLGRGFVLHRRGAFHQAIREYRRAVAIDDELVPAHVYLGDAYLALGRLDLARVEFRKALALDRSEPLAHSNLGRLHSRLGEHDEAIARQERAVELAPEAARFHSNLGAALFAAGRIPEAIGAFRQASRLDPDFLPARVNLARALQEGGHAIRAGLATRRVIRAYRDRIREAPREPALHLDLGRFLLDVADRPDEARPEIERAVALDPDHVPALETLADLRLREKNYPAARALLEQILRRDPATLPRERSHYRDRIAEVEEARAIVEGSVPA